jgi:hypothetical protein
VQEIEFQLKPADLEAWYLYHLDSVNTYRYQYWATAVIVSGFCAVKANQWTSSTVVSAAAAVVGFAAGWYGGRAGFQSWLRAIVRQRAKAPASATEFGTHRLSLDASGVSETDPAAQHRHLWKAVEGFSETSDHLFLLVVGGAAYIVPKRAFGTEAAFAAFRSAIAEATANRAPRT